MLASSRCACVFISPLLLGPERDQQQHAHHDRAAAQRHRHVERPALLHLHGDRTDLRAMGFLRIAEVAVNQAERAGGDQQAAYDHLYAAHVISSSLSDHGPLPDALGRYAGAHIAMCASAWSACAPLYTLTTTITE